MADVIASDLGRAAADVYYAVGLLREKGVLDGRPAPAAEEVAAL